MNSFDLRDKPKINVLIIDDHKLIRDGLKTMLASLKKNMLFCVDEAQSGEDALIKMRRKSYDLALIDYQMPGISGAETIYRTLRFNSQMKMLALSSYDEISYIQSMIDAGAKGYVLKDIEPKEMQNAIQAILSNQPYYCSKVAVKLMEYNEINKLTEIKAKRILTPRQIQVLQLIVKEMTNEEIARELNVNKRTIDTHRQNLLVQLRAKNTAGLVNAAYRLKLVEV
jgi:DNA-binding NarL/FixJ family response regulator